MAGRGEGNGALVCTCLVVVACFGKEKEGSECEGRKRENGSETLQTSKVFAYVSGVS